MKMGWTKSLAVLLALCLAIGCLPCAMAEGATRVFTDSLGREVTVPAEITKVAVSSPLAQIVFFALCPDKLAGIASEWDAYTSEYLSTEDYELPVLGQIYGGKGEMNLEALLLSGAEIVIDVGAPKNGMAEELDALQTQVGIPFVHISAYMESMGETYRMLGELMNMPQEAETLAAYCARVYERTLSLANSVQKANLIYVTGADGLNVIAKGSFHAEVIDLLANNLAVVDEPTGKGTGNVVDMEQILNWNPDVVLFAPDSIYETVGENALWQNVSAIQSGKYYKVPMGPYNWMGFPPSVHRLLGLMWMGKLLYPEQADYDLYAEVSEYFKLFYHCDLTEAQYAALTADSIGKQAD